VYEGEDAVKKVREAIGKTNPDECEPWSIRGKYGKINTKIIAMKQLFMLQILLKAQKER